MKYAGFIGSSYTARSSNFDRQRAINLYVEVNESGRGKEQEPAALVATPGLRLRVALGAGPNRGSWLTSTGRLFVVSGDTLYEVDNTWTGTSRGALITSTGNVSMADNGISLALVDGDNQYHLTLADNTFAQDAQVTFLGATHVRYLDGYFLYNRPDTGQFYWSNLNSTVIDGLDIATSEGNPDKIVGTLVDHREFWAFNQYTTEVFFNSGDDPVFQRIQGAFIEHGCAAAFSVAKLNNSVFWLGGDDKGHGVVYMAQGYQPQKISTTGVDIAIQGYSDISDAVAYTYQSNGHMFYVISFPTGNATWAYDVTTGQWHERAYFNAGTFARHRAQCHAFAFGYHVVGDYENGNLYTLDDAYFYEDVDGAKVFAHERIGPHVSAGLKLVTHNAFQLDMEVGVGDGTEGQGSDPVVILQYSDDSGRTWSNELEAKIGKIGETRKRIIWRRLGHSRDRIYKVRITDPVKVILLGAELDLEVGAS